ncbi:3-oxoadipyl-CoA thiolase [Rhodobacter sp. SGA-6-6]|uniref:3-oxoadipyl-CoA thiolase n=1 Tax=Rhodobacter sp. SGA-6-6 TaxID=2710882 RepID=UPI0013EC96C2|nr:3-oxoadipyl-CoA thiolase [Rhodobacter sp. SGA-6-6]NGM46027.1 3-oxoadipyl-CoA thiolase [Rhodobacter sp. SGA-6-6]
MKNAWIVDGIRTPFGRHGGALAHLRADDLAAVPLAALIARHPEMDPALVEDVVLGCVNQAGEDNRNVARMALLLAGLPVTVPGVTVNRLCGSGLEAVGQAARTIRCGEADLLIAGGVEHMTRSPFVMAKAEAAFSRRAEIFDTTIGWRFANPRMEAAHGIDSMPQTADNLAQDYAISREDQDAFALRSQNRWAAARAAGRFDAEITPVTLPQRRGDPLVFDTDEHPRPETTADQLRRLKPLNGPVNSVTAGNASGVNDGAAAVMLASDRAVWELGLEPRARVVAMTAAGVAPRVMGYGPVPAVQRLLARTGLTIRDMDVVELNEAFAAQSLAVLRGLGLPDDAGHVNPNGGAIAVGHPLGASGARLALTAVHELERRGGRYALCTMCIGVGQGIALLIERTGTA